MQIATDHQIVCGGHTHTQSWSIGEDHMVEFDILGSEWFSSYFSSSYRSVEIDSGLCCM